MTDDKPFKPAGVVYTGGKGKSGSGGDTTGGTGPNMSFETGVEVSGVDADTYQSLVGYVDALKVGGPKFSVRAKNTFANFIVPFEMEEISGPYASEPVSTTAAQAAAALAKAAEALATAAAELARAADKLARLAAGGVATPSEKMPPTTESGLPPQTAAP